MSQQDFLTALQSELRRRDADFDRTELREFAASAWSLGEEDPDPVRWARAFIDAGDVS